MLRLVFGIPVRLHRGCTTAHHHCGVGRFLLLSRRMPTRRAARVLVRSRAPVRSWAGSLGRVVVALAGRGWAVFVDTPFVLAALAVAALVDSSPVQGVLADHVVDGRAQVTQLFLE